MSEYWEKMDAALEEERERVKALAEDWEPSSEIEDNRDLRSPELVGFRFLYAKARDAVSEPPECDKCGESHYRRTQPFRPAQRGSDCDSSLSNGKTPSATEAGTTVSKPSNGHAEETVLAKRRALFSLKTTDSSSSPEQSE